MQPQLRHNVAGKATMFIILFNDSVLTFSLPTKNNACAVKTGLTTENQSD